MSRLADIFVRVLGDKLNPTDKRDIQSGFSVLEGTVKDLGASIGPGGRGSRISSGSVVLNNGVDLFNPSTGYKTAEMSPDGDFALGYDLARPAFTSFKVLSNDRYYNGETLGYGDVLLGDNTSGAANLLWDRSTGRLNFRGGTTVNAYIDSDGYLTATGATITGTITASAGAIGGWTIDATRIYNSNYIELDSANSQIKVGTADDIVIDGSLGRISSSNYASGVSGFLLNKDGYAEFGNILARGEIRTAVFVTDEVQASGGVFAVTYKVGVLKSDFTTPVTSTAIEIKNDGNGSTCSFANNDYIRLKSPTYDYWGKLTSKVQYADRAEFTCTTQSGSTGVAFKAGQAIIGYDSSAGGSVYLNATDDSVMGYAANISILSHSASPWSDQTLRVRIGNLKGSYGDASDYGHYGFGVGDFSAGNYMVYNANGTGGFVISAADGGVKIDQNYIKIYEPSVGNGGMDFYYGSDRTGIIYTDHSSSYSYVWVSARREGSSPPWSSGSRLVLNALDSIAGKDVRVELYSTGLVDFQSVNTILTDGDIKLSSGGLAVGSASFTPPSGDIHFNGNAVCLVDGSGGGYYAGASNDVHLYRYAANRWYTPDNFSAGGYFSGPQFIATVDGSSGGLYAGATNDVQWYRNNTDTWRTPDNVRVDGDLFTVTWTDYSASSTITGWSSYTNKYIEYKLVGKLVFVAFHIEGTSNSTDVTFTLPNAEGHALYSEFTCMGYDGTGGWRLVHGLVNGSTVRIYGGADYTSTNWQNSSGKQVRGQFFYQKS